MNNSRLVMADKFAAELKPAYRMSFLIYPEAELFISRISDRIVSDFCRLPGRA